MPDLLVCGREEKVQPWLSLESVFLGAFVLLGGAIILMSIRLGFGTAEEPGSGFFPFFVGLFVFLTAGSLTVRSGWGKKPKAVPLNLFEDSGKCFWGMVVTFLAWIFLARWLGYLIVTFLASLAFSKILGEKGWIRSLALAAGITTLIYLLFDLWFYLDLPRGFLD
jgi:hypothetical protein